jgi:hypothetical protein
VLVTIIKRYDSN